MTTQMQQTAEQRAAVEDTFVGRGEVFVEGPVEDVGDVCTQRVTCAGVHRVLRHLPVRHAGALGTTGGSQYRTP